MELSLAERNTEKKKDSKKPPPFAPPPPREMFSGEMRRVFVSRSVILLPMTVGANFFIAPSLPYSFPNPFGVHNNPSFSVERKIKSENVDRRPEKNFHSVMVSNRFFVLMKKFLVFLRGQTIFFGPEELEQLISE